MAITSPYHLAPELPIVRQINSIGNSLHGLITTTGNFINRFTTGFRTESIRLAVEHPRTLALLKLAGTVAYGTLVAGALGSTDHSTHGIANQVSDLFSGQTHNLGSFGDNLNSIEPAKLSCGLPERVIIPRGGTLWQEVTELGLTGKNIGQAVTHILNTNNISDARSIQAGQVLNIPEAVCDHLSNIQPQVPDKIISSPDPIPVDYLPEPENPPSSFGPQNITADIIPQPNTENVEIPAPAPDWLPTACFGIPVIAGVLLFGSHVIRLLIDDTRGK